MGIIQQRATLPHLITTNDLLCNFDMRRLTGKGNIKRTYRCADKKALAKRIILHFMHTMFEDFVQGGKTFVFPTRTYMEIQMHRIATHNLKNVRQRGSLEEIDLIASGMKAYGMSYVCRTKSGADVRRNLRVSDKLWQVVVDKTNKGYTYC